MLALIQRYALAGVAVLLAAAVGLAGVQTVRLSNEQAAHQKTIADHATARAEAIQAARAQEQAYASKIADAVHTQAKRAMVAEADAVRAAGAVDRLRERAKAVARGVSGDPASTCRSEADLIADAIGRVGEAAKRIAATADDAIGRGLTCEAAYPITR